MSVNSWPRLTDFTYFVAWEKRCISAVLAALWPRPRGKVFRKIFYMLSWQPAQVSKQENCLWLLFSNSATLWLRKLARTFLDERCMWEGAFCLCTHTHSHTHTSCSSQVSLSVYRGECVSIWCSTTIRSVYTVPPEVLNECSAPTCCFHKHTTLTRIGSSLGLHGNEEPSWCSAVG